MAQDTMKERLQKAYGYLYDHGFVHSVTDLADKMGRSRSSVSRAINGSPEYLNEKFIAAFVFAFTPIFSLKWMLIGEGEMLMKDETVEEPEPFPWLEKMEFLNDLLDKEKEKNEILQKQVSNMEQQIADQRQQIADQRQQIADLKQQLADQVKTKKLPVESSQEKM